MSTIAVTNAVTGNVGSCKVEKTTVGISAFKSQDIATNSCTGEVMTYPEYVGGGVLFGGFIIGLLILLIVLLGVASA